jgi:hypothetical protein
VSPTVDGVNTKFEDSMEPSRLVASKRAFRRLAHSDDDSKMVLSMGWNALVRRYSHDRAAMKILAASDEARALNAAVLMATTQRDKVRAIRAALKRIPEIAALTPAGPPKAGEESEK